MDILVTALAVVVALLAVLVVGLLRSNAEILRSLRELGVDLDPDSPTSGVAGSRAAGSRSGGLTVPRPRVETRVASDVSGRAPNGDAVSVSVLGASQPTLLAFLTSGCTTCAGFWTALSSREEPSVPGGARVVVVTKGEEAESPARLAKFAPPTVPVVMSSEAWTAYDVPVAPYFSYVDPDAGTVVGEGAAATWEQLVAMMEQALADAGLSTTARGRRAKPRRSDAPARADAALRSAGIEPGDPSLYPRHVGQNGPDEAT